MITQYDKALVALCVGVVFFLCGHFGFVPNDSLTTLITGIVSSLVVYFVPNKAQV